VQSVYPVPIATIFQNPMTGWFGVSYHFEGRQPHYALDTHFALDDALRAADPHNERIWEEEPSVSMAVRKRSILARRMGPGVWLRSGHRRVQKLGTAVAGAFYAGLFSPALTCGAR
jgi:hypothetical protein